MKKFGRAGLLALTLGLISSGVPLSAVQAAPASQSAAQTLDWMDLLPADDLASLEDRPALLDSIEEGSDADSIDSLLESQAGKLDPKELAHLQRYQQALTSTNTRTELVGKLVKVPGYVVPLEYDDDQGITELFLVPFFGACIHVPPPPPNQIIHVRLKEPLQLESLYDPVWMVGTLRSGQVNTDMGLAAYQLDVRSVEPYEGE